MIILQFTAPEFLGLALALALLMLCAVIAAYCLGSGSVNVELEIMRKRSSVESCGFRAPPPPPPPRRPFNLPLVQNQMPMPKCNPAREEL